MFFNLERMTGLGIIHFNSTSHASWSTSVGLSAPGRAFVLGVKDKCQPMVFAPLDFIPKTNKHVVR
jgi:hypothetical protein